jgi:hypothetical protein
LSDPVAPTKRRARASGTSCACKGRFLEAAGRTVAVNSLSLTLVSHTQQDVSHR